MTDEAPADDPSTLGDIVAGLPVAVFRSTAEGWFVAGNTALAALLGADSFDHLRRTNVRDLYVSPARRDYLLDRVLAGESVPAERIELRRFDGTRIWVRVRSSPVRDADGTIAYFEGVMEDVSDLTRANLELDRSHALLTAVTSMQSQYLAGGDLAAQFDDVLDALMATMRAEHGIIADLRERDGQSVLRSWATSQFHWDPLQTRTSLPDGRIACEVPTTGNPLAQVVDSGAPLLSNAPLNPSTEVSPTVGELRNLVAVPVVRGGSVTGVVAVANREGDFADWAIDYLGPVAAAVGSLISAATAEQDRDEAVQRQNAITDFARDIVAEAADAIILVDDTGIVTDVNAAAARLFETEPDGLVGHPLRSLIPEGRGADYRRRALDALSGDSAIEVEVITRSGARRDLEITFVRAPLDGRELTAIIGRDIGARKQWERAMLDARDAAEQAVRVKDDLLAGMSHELRTPLNSVIGLAAILGRGIHGPLSDAQADAVSRIESSGRHLLAIINDILEAARSESDGIHPEVADVLLSEVVHAAVDLVAELAAQRAISVELDDGIDDAPMLRVDHRRTVQMLVNLLGNAIKFTDTGGAVGVQVARDSGHVAVTVWDTGIGIPGEHLDAIFDPFIQVDSSLAKKHGGTGLGLTLTRRIARAQGGDVTVESAQGVGSRFTVTLPVAGHFGAADG